MAQIADLQPKFANSHSRHGGEGSASFSTTEASVAAKVWIGRRTRELCTSGVYMYICIYVVMHSCKILNRRGEFDRRQIR